MKDFEECLRADERVPSVFHAPVALAVGVIAVLLTVFAVWCVYGRIDDDVFGTGVVMRQTRYATVSSPGDGFVYMFNVAKGDSVTAGQLLGCIYTDEEQERLFVANRKFKLLKDDYRRLADEFGAVSERQDVHRKAFMRHLDEFDSRLKRQVEWYGAHLKNLDQLQRKGGLSAEELHKAMDLHDQRELQQEKIRADRLDYEAAFDRTRYEMNFKLLEKEESLLAAGFEAERVHREVFFRSMIVAGTSGRVSNVNIDEGDRVRTGQQLLRIEHSLSDGTLDAWMAIAYYPVSEARKFEVGMDAIVTPSTVKAERDGGIRGLVASVGRDLETPESIFRDYRNDSLTKWVLERTGGMPVKVKILLSCDTSSTSGFRWTSGPGPDIRIANGTLCATAVTVRSLTPLELAFAKTVRYISGVGEREEEVIGLPDGSRK